MKWFASTNRIVPIAIRDCTAEIWFRHPMDGLLFETITIEGYAWADYLLKCIIPEDGRDRLAEICREWAKGSVVPTKTAIVPWSAFVGAVVMETHERVVDVVVPARWRGLP